VYVLVNEAMAGIVKIGYSAKLSEDRAKKLHTTGVPVGFEVHSRCLTSHAETLEKRVHDRLAPHRVAPNREFFRVPPSVASDVVLEVRAEVDGIDGWSAARIAKLRSGDRLLLSLRAGQLFVVLSYPSLSHMMAGRPAVPRDIWQAHLDGDTLEIYATGDRAKVRGLSDHDPDATKDPVPHLDREESVPNDVINGSERLVPGDRLLWMDSLTGENDCTSLVLEAVDYCQIVSRTRSCQFSPDGLPLLLNVTTRDSLPPGMVRAAQDALKLPLPRSWAPYSDRSDEWTEVGTQSAPPEYWLTQLRKTRSTATRAHKRIHHQQGGRDLGLTFEG
jgi:hypothetical protein